MPLSMGERSEIAARSDLIQSHHVQHVTGLRFSAAENGTYFPALAAASFCIFKNVEQYGYSPAERASPSLTAFSSI